MLVLPSSFNQTFLLVDNYYDDNLTSLELPEISNESIIWALPYKAHFNPVTNKLELNQLYNSSQENFGIICQQSLDCYDTGSPAGHDTFYFLKGYKFNKESAKMVSQKISEVQEIFERIDMAKSYEAIFSSLWYGSLPCIPIEGMTGEQNDHDASILKYCQWRGIQIECAAIFNTFPTDYGMCCSFNLKAAEEIYRGKIYTGLVKKLQEHEKKHTNLVDSTLPDWYTNGNEPKTVPGRNKGLFVMLDAHSEMLAPTSLNQDYTSFTGLISNRGSFPFMAQEGFEIRPGVNFTKHFHDNSKNLSIFRNEYKKDKFFLLCIKMFKICQQGITT
jgi:hypothetical protein